MDNSLLLLFIFVIIIALNYLSPLLASLLQLRLHAVWREGDIQTFHQWLTPDDRQSLLALLNDDGLHYHIEPLSVTATMAVLYQQCQWALPFTHP